MFQSIQHSLQLKKIVDVSAYGSTPNKDVAPEKKRKSNVLVDSNLSGMTKALNEKAKASMKTVKKSRNEALVDAESRLEKITQDLIVTLTEFRKQVPCYLKLKFFFSSIILLLHFFFSQQRIGWRISTS